MSKTLYSSMKTTVFFLNKPQIFRAIRRLSLIISKSYLPIHGSDYIRMIISGD
jgi:hypothetical protein